MTYLNYATSGESGTKDLVGAQKRQNAQWAALGIRGSSYSHSTLIGSGLLETHGDVLSQARGAGYCLWKPYIILRELNSVATGSVVCYADSDMTIASASLLRRLEAAAVTSGMALVTGGPFSNLAFCKRDSLILTGVDGDDIFLKQHQVWAGIGLYKACTSTIEFVKTWLETCKLPGILTDDPSVLGPELPGFQEHRHDQSVLACLVHKHSIELCSNSDAQAFAHPA